MPFCFVSPFKKWFMIGCIFHVLLWFMRFACSWIVFFSLLFPYFRLSLWTFLSNKMNYVPVTIYSFITFFYHIHTVYSSFIAWKMFWIKLWNKINAILKSNITGWYAIMTWILSMRSLLLLYRRFDKKYFENRK